MSTLGLKILSNPTTWKAVDDAGNNQIATTLGGTLVVPSDGWLTEIGGWLDATAGVPRVYFAVWAVDGAGAPGDFLGRSDLIAVSASGADNIGSVVLSATEALSSIRVSAGQKIAIGLVLQGGEINVGIAGSGLLTVYERTVGAVVPTNPFAHTAISQAAMSLYVTFAPNSAPSAPISLSPADASTVQDFSPSFSATFSDVDQGAPEGDLPHAVEFEARNNATNALLWYGPSAWFLLNDSEQEDGIITRTYNGAALTAGTVIKWRVRFYDLAETPGAWSAYRTLTIGQGPAVVLTAPTGKVDGPTQEIDWSGSVNWNPDDITHLQFRVFKGAALYKESAEIDVAGVVLDDVPWTLSGEEIALGILGPGLALTGRARAKEGDTGTWGSWSAPISFTTNFIPTVPSSLQPPNGTVQATYPVVTFRSVDTDDAMGSETIAELEITDPNGDVTVVDVSAYNGTTNEFSIALTNSEMPLEGAYRLRARSKDLSASDGFSEWSDYVVFTLDLGLTVTIASPTEGQVITDTTPDVTVSLSAGTPALARIVIYPKDSNTISYDSQVFAATTTLLDTLTAGILQNGESYDLQVWVQNSGGLAGWSARRQFSVNYTAPDALANAQATLYAFPLDPEGTSVLFSWQRANVPASTFAGYVVRRRYAGRPASEGKLIKQIASIGQNTWIDAYAPANAPLTYSVQSLTKTPDNGVQPSAPIEVTIDIPLTVIVVQSTKEPSKRLILRWKPAQRRGLPKQDKTLYYPWGREGKPIVIFGEGEQMIVEDTFRLLGDDKASRETHFNAGLELFRAKAPVQWKEERLSFFGVITTFEWEQFDNTDSVKVRVEEIDFTEGGGQPGILTSAAQPNSPDLPRLP